MDDTIAAFRRFNQFFTELVGALDDQFLGCDVTLPEARLLFEIAMHDPTEEPATARAMQARLGMDAGFVSRILARFEERGWITRARGTDARARPIHLTEAGRSAFELVDERQRTAIVGLVGGLDPVQRADLAEAMARVRLLLRPETSPGFVIRPFRTGDMGLITARQSMLYAQSHGWGRGLEIVEGEATTAFLRSFKPGREQCWVAEIDGVMAGSVFLTDEGEDVARLRLLYVEPFARCRGIGDTLVQTCIGFARETGYARLTLWTHTVLEGARRIYARHGFHRIDTATHTAFGTPIQGETWMLDLHDPVEAPAQPAQAV
ncbi:MAG TPA: bifunctional helix-turn-helix transcriptional regulator/GNAT family N-acetyltransferase [Methylobacterium sp.]|jgi:DNA-binding MarR family transcriptional regulator/GNAT superfamily N-acetyltransferase|uniref:bifunctional helix-turn-helix transcriptional regulator/GNAT family N-acetyltransferase n=1 Tax=Methylorubrum sp. B1-46 TaxID=2897334 RepID=UPI001E62A009|nr:bifunctional helix-turn-helix transcriptional regulator/GNAT family N-acetyltransferase [Methylorubrum sp. B1-46]UGB28043.1 bifunctional helix-turn-helix transcriptional regulator/GNAT family N-acetyltransferase [Methylorubrum sp. B1-46]HEV2541496.1 bifunctional helix-turn-helix transcriptional regulator/GNAT family N-acetyltransferase [Methylobacterium sp.]